MIDLAVIRVWLKAQDDASNFGGTCEYDHEGAFKHIEALIAEVERLNVEQFAFRQTIVRELEERQSRIEARLNALEDVHPQRLERHD